ncbi:complex I NDUFA9 subunit family protein [Wenxinia marina]|uniref:Putative nucleoside-diphosphate-sugar epimerase n=1 Tax=Wenxinia marina DSM 24838 TaxID=1123501 RepID=A0A0D0PHW2_9RHOB|nr:complex I NDUFA9 subunit family protein [Wenxinia marina]KIQ70976.1 putative nucleoside-diphosphate-sugar epimerase [Wenxinia marina DSM 24838]GGL55809.1 3-beta-hydroxy-Delta(5)-steroid dehydrogenase [Wenxinia marina]
MAGIVTIFGGSGFLGRYIARRLAKDGWRIRVACRRPNEAIQVRTYGVVGQVVPVFCNIRDDASVREVTRGVQAVVNCVGTFDARGKNNFEAVQDEGAGRIARIAAEEGVGRMVHISAIGAGEGSDSTYGRTKAAGEKAVLQHMPGAVILRPSVLFGPEDEFFNRFASMSRTGPILPVVGGNTRFQPVYVDDVAAAAQLGVNGKAAPGVYELGGPDVHTFRELMEQMLAEVQRRRAVVNIPFWLAKIMAGGFNVLNFLTGGLAPMPISPDQVRQLRHDNVVADGARGFAELGIQPTAMEAVLPDYLWRFRPSGQYAEIKASASNLRGGSGRAGFS